MRKPLSIDKLQLTEDEASVASAGYMITALQVYKDLITLSRWMFDIANEDLKEVTGTTYGA
jgi:hypothetical protein|tara:strand:- start:444 stop:626 length:183 start_codon:yes stop_codon:yes gene_type:complete